MKLSITDWQKSTNALVLAGSVTGLNAPANTADVTIGGQAFPAVPIHYLCHHNADNHAASRVFKVGDQVQVLYLGNSAAPSSANLTVVGLVGELRRCRTLWNLVANLNRADGTEFGTSYGQWGFLGPSIQRVTETALGGYNWWTDGLRTLSWQMLAPSRYSVGSNNGGTAVYRDGALLATSPVAVAGAALQGDDLIVFGYNGHVWKRSAATGSWSHIYSWDLYVFTPAVAISINADCTSAVTLVDNSGGATPYCALVQFTISGDVVTMSWSDQLHSDAVGWNKPVAVDYRLNTLLTATVYCSYTESITADVFNYSRVYINDAQQCGVYSYNSQRTTVKEWTTQLRTPDQTHNLEHTVQTDGFTSSGLMVGYTTPGGSPYVASSISTIDYQSEASLILGMDLRTNHLAVYRMQQQPKTLTTTTTSATVTNTNCAINVSGSSSSTTNATGVVFYRSKELNSAIVDDRPSLLCPPESISSYTHYLMPAASVTDFDPVVWSSGGLVPVSTVALPMRSKSYGFMSSLTSNFLVAEKSGDRLVSWKTSNTATYCNYSGGDVAALTGLSGPLYATGLVVT